MSGHATRTSVCTTNTGQFKLKLGIDQIDEYGATLLVREMSKCCILQAETVVTTAGIANLYLELVKGGRYRAEHGKIISKLNLYLKALR